MIILYHTLLPLPHRPNSHLMHHRLILFPPISWDALAEKDRPDPRILFSMERPLDRLSETRRTQISLSCTRNLRGPAW